MKNSNPELVKILEEILDAELGQNPIPVVKGNSIRIKNTVVRKNKHGYHVFDLTDKSHIGYTHSKATALAIAHCTARNQHHAINNIRYLDNKLSKYYNDAIFHKHTVENSDDRMRREMARMRFDIAMDECWRIKAEIEDYLFDK